MTLSSFVSAVWTRRILTMVALLPIVIAVVTAVAGDWYPTGDIGLLALRVDDVASANHPLLGSWTSASLSLGIDVNNPGAWYAYIAWPAVALLGPVAGVPIAVGLINAGSVIGIGQAARRLGGPVCEFCLLAAAAALGWSMGSELLVDLWQPHALLLPLLLLMVLAAGAATGRGVFFPPLVIMASLVVQTHLGHTYVLLILLGVVVVSAAARRWNGSSRDLVDLARSPYVAWSGLGAVIMWLPAIVEQIANGRDGNLWRLATNSGGGDVSLGVEQATQITARIIAIPPFWSRGSFESAIVSTSRTGTGESITVVVPGLPNIYLALLGLALLVALLGVLLRWAGRSGRDMLSGSLVLAIAVVPASVVSLTVLTVGPTGFAAHHARWLFALSVFVHGVVVWGVIDWVVDRRPAMRPKLVGVVMAIVVVVSLANLPSLAHDVGPVADRSVRPTLREIESELANATLPEPVVFETDNLRIFEPYSGPVMMQLGSLGIDFRLRDDSWTRQVGSNRKADGSELGVLYQLEGAEALLHEGADCVIVLTASIDPVEASRLSSLVDLVVSNLIEGDATIDTSKVIDDPRSGVYSSAIATADQRALSRLILDGALAEWTAAGAGDPETTSLMAADGPAIAHWVRSSYGLFLETDEDCDQVLD